MREEELHIHSSPNEVGSVQGLLNYELLRISEGETGYFRKMLRQSSVQTEATTHHWVIYYVVQHIYKSWLSSLVPEALFSIVIIAPCRITNCMCLNYYSPHKI